MASATPPYYDPFSREINANPHSAFKRLRDECPLYYNERYDFYAVSRFQDVRNCRDPERFMSSLGSSPIERMPNADLKQMMLVEMDPPEHGAFRRLSSMHFAPKSIRPLEPVVRSLVTEYADPLAGAGSFDFVQDFAKHIPMRVICGLLGIVGAEREDLVELLWERAERYGALVDGGEYSALLEVEEQISSRLLVLANKRKKDPQDDLLTALAHAEVDDPETGLRRLTDEELSAYCAILFQGGNATSTLLLSWVALLLGKYPDQRKILRDDPTFVPNAVEEILRFEPIAHVQGRYTSGDLEIYDQKVPIGSKFLLLPGAACRDERHYERPDEFEVRRDVRNHLAFGWGIHGCIGAHLARLQARIVLEEILARFPNWTVDESNAQMQITSTLRGYSHLPFAS